MGKLMKNRRKRCAGLAVIFAPPSSPPLPPGYQQS